MIFEPRDREILQALALKVRLFSLAQIAATWWKPTDTGRALARRRLMKLSQAGMLKRLRVLARPLPELTGPLGRLEPRPRLTRLRGSCVGTPTPLVDQAALPDDRLHCHAEGRQPLRRPPPRDP